MKPPIQTIGQKVRSLRMKKGMTQIELAKGIVTPSMISQLEADKARPSYKVLSAIAERLNVSMDTLLADADLNLEITSTHKWARALFAAEEYQSAIPLYLELLANPLSELPRLEILLDLGQCYLHTGHSEEAERLLLLSQETAVQQENHLAAALVRKHLGVIEFNRKRYQFAVCHWQRALDELEHATGADVFLRASLLYNLGLAYRCLGQVSDAIAFHEQAAETYAGLGHPKVMGRVYLDLGQAHRSIHDLEKAIFYTEKATACFECMENIRLALQTQVSQAALYAESGRVQEAEQLLQNAISEFERCEDNEGAGAATVELAKVKLRQDQAEEAEGLLQRARVLLPEMHLYQGFVNQTLGKIALSRNNREAACKWFVKAADCFKAFGEHGEWDATMYQIVKVHQDQGDYRSAFLALDEIRRNALHVLEQRGIVL